MAMRTKDLLAIVRQAEQRAVNDTVRFAQDRNPQIQLLMERSAERAAVLHAVARALRGDTCLLKTYL